MSNIILSKLSKTNLYYNLIVFLNKKNMIVKKKISQFKSEYINFKKKRKKFWNTYLTFTMIYNTWHYDISIRYIECYIIKTFKNETNLYYNLIVFLDKRNMIIKKIYLSLDLNT